MIYVYYVIVYTCCTSGCRAVMLVAVFITFVLSHTLLAVPLTRCPVSDLADSQIYDLPTAWLHGCMQRY